MFMFANTCNVLQYLIVMHNRALTKKEPPRVSHTGVIAYYPERLEKILKPLKNLECLKQKNRITAKFCKELKRSLFLLHH